MAGDEEMLVSDLMSAPVHAAEPHDTVSYARNIMLRHRISRVLILDDGRAAGIVTKKDIGYQIRKKDPDWRFRQKDSDPLSSVMSANLVICSSDSSIRDVLMLMITHQISGVPVIDQGMVLGIVTRTDLLRSQLIRELDIPIRDIMRDPVCVSPDHSSAHVVDLIRNGAGAVVVKGNSMPAGIITETDLAFYENLSDKPGSGTASAVMRPNVPVLPESSRSGEAVAMMLKNGFECVLVTGETGIKGIITRDDIIREVVQ